MKAKILFLTNDLGLGGVQRLVVDFANRFDQARFELVVGVLFSRPDSFFYQDQLRPDLRLAKFNFKSYRDLRAWWRFYKFLQAEKFDLVFTQLFMADFIGRITAWLAGVPVIVTEIQNLIPNLPGKYIFIDRLLKHLTTVCLSTTPAVTTYAREVIGFRREKIVEIPTNAVDDKRFKIAVNRQEVRQALGCPVEAKLIINVGRLVEQKGQKFLVEAVPAVLKQCPEAYFIIAGSGKLAADLQARINELNLQTHCQLLGDRQDVPQLLLASDVFAFPSVWEGQGLVLFEAFFSQLSIVASDVGGIPDVIKHEETGLLVEPGNADHLAQGIIRLLSDQDLKRRLTTEALKRYGDRTIAKAVKKMEDLFQKLILVSH